MMGGCSPFKLSCLAIETSSGNLKTNKLTVSVQYWICTFLLQNHSKKADAWSIQADVRHRFSKEKYIKESSSDPSKGR
jgi:hypothetical protein